MDLTDVVGSALHLAARARESIGDALLPSNDLSERLRHIPTQLGPHGVDAFGFDPEFLRRVAGLGVWFYRYYFRCETFGVHNVPDGRCFVVANHSGQLPFDGAMITCAVLLEREPPRYLRSMVERFVPSTPFVSMFLARCGQILGTPSNCKRLLDAEEAVMVFPEGVGGLNKTWKHRYKLQKFGTGFMRLAIEKKAPIVPAVVIGAEEQAPSFYNCESVGRLIGLPALPVTPTHPWLPGIGMWPLPVRYRIYFGEPMTISGNANDEDYVITEKVEEVRTQMQQMLDKHLAERTTVFW